MSQPDHHATGLLDLPPELIELILEEGDSYACFNLRLACRDVSAKADHFFVNTYFTTRSFYLQNRASMAVLLGISQTRRLARRLTIIQLSLSELEYSFGDRGNRRCMQRQTRDDRAKYREARRIHQLLCDDQERYCRSQNTTDLVQIFGNFLDHECFPGILATGHGDIKGFGRPAGHARLEHMLGYDEVMVESTFARPVGALWDAMSKTSYPASRLEIGSTYQTLPLRQLSSSPILTCRLESLSLAFWSRASSDHSMAWSQDLDSLIRLLQDSPSLKNLNLTMDNQGACPEFHVNMLFALCILASADHSPRTVEPTPPALQNLRCLRMDGFQIDAGTFLCLVELLPALHEVLVANIPGFNRRHAALRIAIRDVLIADKPEDSVKVTILNHWFRMHDRGVVYRGPIERRKTRLSEPHWRRYHRRHLDASRERITS